MKKLFAILVLTTIIAQSLSKLMIIWEYNLNKEFIAKNLCENRSKPASCCEGKCQLSKALDEDTQKPLNLVKDKSESPALCLHELLSLAAHSLDLFSDSSTDNAPELTEFSVRRLRPPLLA